MEAHEHAEKGAVTDAMKRALRTYGAQFGNGLYGDGTADISTPTVDTSVLTAIMAECKRLGLASDAETWATYKKSVLGKAIPNDKLSVDQLAQPAKSR